MPRVPNLSILSKLYAIIALFATVTVMLAVVAIGTRQAREAYAEAHAGVDLSSTWMMGLSAFAVLLAAATALILWRAVARPLAQITQVTAAVANGEAATIPYTSRRDEMG